MRMVEIYDSGCARLERMVKQEKGDIGGVEEVSGKGDRAGSERGAGRVGVG